MKAKITLIAALTVCLTQLASAQEATKLRLIIDSDENGTKEIVDTTFSSLPEMQAWMEAHGHQMQVIPPVVALPDLPEMPDWESLPDLKALDLNLVELDSDLELSEADRARIHAELEKAHVELEKAHEAMELNKDELDKAREEMKKIHIEFKKEFGNENLMLLRDTSMGNHKCVIVICDSNSGEAGVPMVREIKEAETLPAGAQQKIRVIRLPEAEAQETDPENAATPSIPEAREVSEAGYTLAPDNFNLYPNPTQGKVRVTFNSGNAGPVSVKILDVSGRAIIDETVASPDGSFDKEYTITNQSRGTYLLQLKQGSQWRHEKIILK